MGEEQKIFIKQKNAWKISMDAWLASYLTVVINIAFF